MSGPNTKRTARRRGSVYIAVLGSATLVTVLGLSALVLARIGHRQAGQRRSLARARLNALAAVDMGFFLIKQNPAGWRSDFAAGVLPTDQPIGQTGTFSLEAIDPVDADLANNNSDPVLLIGIGCAGRARYKLQVRLEADGSPTPGTWRHVVGP